MDISPGTLRTLQERPGLVLDVVTKNCRTALRAHEEDSDDVVWGIRIVDEIQDVDATGKNNGFEVRKFAGRGNLRTR